MRKHEITIFGQDEGLGHAFVTFSQEDEKGRMTTFAVLGFYPPEIDDKSERWKVLISNSSGRFRNDFDEIEAAQQKVVLKLDQVQYDRALKILKQWQEPIPTYHAGFNDCTSFVRDIAAAAGMELPSRALNIFPSQPRAIPHQNRRAFGHADRSGVFARNGEGVEFGFDRNETDK